MKEFSRIIVLSVIILLTGCAGKPDRHFSIEMLKEYDGYVMMKTMYTMDDMCNGVGNGKFPRERYIAFGRTCYFNTKFPLPDTLKLYYLPWLSKEQMEKQGLDYPSRSSVYPHEVDVEGVINVMKKREELLDAVPASQWKVITLKPKSLMKKYENSMPEGKGFRVNGIDTFYLITILPDGSYKLEDAISWQTPITNQWN